MPYKQVHNPTKGIFTKYAPFALAQPDGIGADATPYCKGVTLKNGEVSSEYGYTGFPVAGLTKTNQLHGSFMKSFQFVEVDGTTHELAFTTSNVYEFNTSTQTWDCITNGETVDDCESAWTASADVTATNDTATKLRGSKSVKLAIAAAFTTGVAGYIDFASTNFTGNTALHFWIYSSIALSAADFSVRLSEQIAGGAGATYVDFDLPAISANTWTPCCVDGSFTDLNAVLSVAVVANEDVGACNIYVDDIRAVKRFTGDEDNRFSVAVMNNTLVETNGINQPQKYDGTVATGFQDLSTTLNAGTLSTSEIVVAFKDHLVFLNNTENGADAPQRATWTNIGSIEDLINGTAGYQDLTGSADWIIAAKQLGDNQYVVYMENSIYMMDWVGGQTPLRFTLMYGEDGILGKDAVEDIGGAHAVMGKKYLYLYKGDSSIVRLDENISPTLYSQIDGTYQNRSFIIYDKSNDELMFWVATATAYPDEVWVLGMISKAWYRRDKTMLGFGYYVSQSSLTIGDLTGTIGEQNYRIGDYLVRANSPLVLIGNNDGKVFKLDTTTYNNDGVAITNEFQTPDFIAPGTVAKSLVDAYSAKQPDLESFFRVPQLIYEARGSSITTEWSDDGGATWKPTAAAGNNTVTLTGTYEFYQQDFDATVRKIRYRFLNTSASSGYQLRYYGFKWIPRSTRR